MYFFIINNNNLHVILTDLTVIFTPFNINIPQPTLKSVNFLLRADRATVVPHSEQGRLPSFPDSPKLEVLGD